MTEIHARPIKIFSLLTTSCLQHLPFPCSICSHYKAQRENPDTRWGLTEDFSVVYSDVQGELTIGGVFLRLFIANPGWVLRKPKEFLTELMEKWTQLITAQNNDVRKGSYIVLYISQIEEKAYNWFYRVTRIHL